MTSRGGGVPRSSSQTRDAPPIVLPGRVVVGQTFAVGNAVATVIRYLAEGAFAHVYLAETGDGERAVLKRITVPDEEKLIPVMREIQVMREVSWCDKIVQLIDASIDALPSGGFEALLLMEYCPGGHIVELMNSKLQSRLSESEVLQIFSDACEGVACLHYQSPPILHRDIKVENILVSAFGTYKLCDFGSATSETLPENAALSSRLVADLEEDISRNTTLQYRAPEMIDLYQRMGLNEKVDIWALGVLLYKLCFFVTPFDDGNKLAILNCRYQIPSQPSYSSTMTNLIRSMMQLNPWKRPNIYGVLSEVSKIRGMPCPIENIYQNTTTTTRLGPGQAFAPPTTPPPAPALPAAPTRLPDPRNVSPLPVEPHPQPSTSPQPAMRRGRPTGSKPVTSNADFVGKFVALAPPAPVPSAAKTDVDDIFGAMPASVPTAAFETSWTTQPSITSFEAGPSDPFDAFGTDFPSSSAFPPVTAVADPLGASSASISFEPSPSGARPPSFGSNASPTNLQPLPVSPQRRGRSPARPAKSIEDMVSSAVANLASENSDGIGQASSASLPITKGPTLFDMLDSSNGLSSASQPALAAVPPPKPPRTGTGSNSVFDMLNAGSPKTGYSSAGSASAPNLLNAEPSPTSANSASSAKNPSPTVFDLLSSSSSSSSTPAFPQEPAKSAVPVPTKPALPPKPAALRGGGIASRLQGVMDRLSLAARPISPNKNRSMSPSKKSTTSSSAGDAQDSEDEAIAADGWKNMVDDGSGDEGFRNGGGYDSD